MFWTAPVKLVVECPLQIQKYLILTTSNEISKNSKDTLLISFNLKVLRNTDIPTAPTHSICLLSIVFLGVHLDPEEFHRAVEKHLQSDRESLLVDCRNFYESKIVSTPV